MLMKRKTLIVLIFITFAFILSSPAAAHTGTSGPDSPETLNVAVDPSIPPFQFKNGGKLYGLSIDILNLIALDNNIRINYIPINKEASIEKLISGEVDLYWVSDTIRH